MSATETYASEEPGGPKATDDNDDALYNSAAPTDMPIDPKDKAKARAKSKRADETAHLPPKRDSEFPDAPDYSDLVDKDLLIKVQAEREKEKVKKAKNASKSSPVTDGISEPPAPSQQQPPPAATEAPKQPKQNKQEPLAKTLPDVQINEEIPPAATDAPAQIEAPEEPQAPQQQSSPPEAVEAPAAPEPEPEQLQPDPAPEPVQPDPVQAEPEPVQEQPQSAPPAEVVDQPADDPPPPQAEPAPDPQPAEDPEPVEQAEENADPVPAVEVVEPAEPAEPVEEIAPAQPDPEPPVVAEQAEQVDEAPAQEAPVEAVPVEPIEQAEPAQVEPAQVDPPPADPVAEPAVEQVEEPAVEPAQPEPAPQPEADPEPDPEPVVEQPAEDPQPAAPVEEAQPPQQEPEVQPEPAVEPQEPVEEPQAVEPPAPEPQVEAQPEAAVVPVSEPEPAPVVVEQPATEEPSPEVKTEDPVILAPAPDDPVPATEPDAAVEAVEEKIATEPPAAIAIRKEIRDMSPEEQNRFFNAVDKMLENKEGPGTSEYFRVASYHGNPGNHYCAHGNETFPGWHRIYLLEFQNALQEADKQLGGDGNIGLPYWDWTVRPNDGLPKIIRERFSEFPAGLFPDNTEYEWPAIRRNRDSTVAYRLRRGRVVKRANDCLLATQHWAHASTANSRNSRYPSLETPHNSVHVAVGAPMNSVAWAAFDICFWLHHCNIDRIYEGYLKLEPDSAEEFEAFQDNQRKDLFDETFQPFTKPDGTKYTPKDTFSTIELGYEYADLPITDANALQEAPTYAIFEQIRIVEMQGSCYELHVFAVPTATVDEWKPPDDVEEYDNDICYAGFEVIFGKGPRCEACKTRPPYDLRVLLNDTLRDQGLSRYDVTLKVMTVETTNNMTVRPIEETPVPLPIIDGPMFDDRESPMEEANKDTLRREDVEHLQEYLQMFGYYGDEIDGDFGPVTDAAVREYQKLAGLTIDGQVGPITKKQILTAARCGERDVAEGATVANVRKLRFNKPKDQKGFYEGRKDISYSLGVVPGYLRRGDVLGALTGIFDQYSEAAGLTFRVVDDDEKADIKISWTMGQGEKKSVRFDGAGGVLARGGEGFLHLDEAERWTLNPDEAGNLEDRSTWRRGDPVILFQHVALHELGHALGLAHSRYENDVMAPYYNPALVVLSEVDKERVAELYETDEIVSEGTAFDKARKVAETGDESAVRRHRAQTKGKRDSTLDHMTEHKTSSATSPKSLKDRMAMFNKEEDEEPVRKIASPRRKKQNSKFKALGANINLGAMKPGAKPPPKKVKGIRPCRRERGRSGQWNADKTFRYYWWNH